MAKRDNPFNKYSPCGGLNGMWVARELENRDAEEMEDYYDDISISISNGISNALQCIANNTQLPDNNLDNTIINNNYSYFPSIDDIKQEMQARFDFLKQYSDGSESDYDIAKYVLSTMK